MRTAALLWAMRKSGADVELFVVSDYSREDTRMAANSRSGVWAGESSRAGARWREDPLGQPSDADWTPTVHAALETYLRRSPRDIAILDTPLTRAAIPTLRAHGCAVVLEAHNFDTDLTPLLARLASDDADLRLIAARSGPIEQATAASVDAIWACSQPDRAAFQEISETPALVVPNVVRVTPATEGGDRNYDETLYTGSLAYLPNQDAVARLVEIIAVLRSAQPTATLTVAGSSPTERMQHLAAQHSWMTLSGESTSLQPAFRRAGVMAVPLRVGGGTRLKILEAFAAGLPVVSSAKGVEGIDAAFDEHLLRAESDSDFVRQIARLQRSPGLRSTIASAAFNLVLSHYSYESLTPIVSDSLATLLRSR